MRRIVFGTLAVLVLCAGTLTAQSRITVAPTIELARPATSLSLVSGGTVPLWPALGEWLTFRVTLPKSLQKPTTRILINCYQNDQLVYGEAGAYDDAFMLGGSGSLWVYDVAPGDREAPAHCVATLFYWSSQGGQKWNYLAETQFAAAGASGAANSTNTIAAPSATTLAKGGKGRPSLAVGDNTISLVPEGVPHFGQQVTFAVQTTATASPWVTLNCYQNGGQVYHLSLAMSTGGSFPLGPTPSWQSGGADCTATLENWDEYGSNGRITALASLPFTVAP
jgi:hypothetical protein